MIPQALNLSRASWLKCVVSLAFLLLAGCGGGGGDGFVASTPPPPLPPPPPPPPATVTIFANPMPLEYAAAGTSISAPGGNLDGFSSADARFTTVSSADADQPHIRYTSGGFYEIKIPGADWDRLIPYKGLADPGPDNTDFQPQGVDQNYGYLLTSNSRLDGYSYSELAGWGSAAAGRIGSLAFGTPTAAGAVPITGSASYSGIVRGMSDVLVPDLMFGGTYALGTTGTVALDFDFAKATLGGAMDLSLTDGANAVDVGSFPFKDTVFSAGSTSYSGGFATAVSGNNFFLGRFTGPNAEETIGAWALPFMFSNGGNLAPADNQAHQAFGAWIAKKQ